MICPKCRNNVTGKWCSYCGAKLDDDPAQHLSQNGGSANYQNSGNANRDVRYNSDNKFNQEAPFSPEDAVNPYGGYYSEAGYGSNGKGKLIAVISICVVILFLVGFILFKFVFSDNSKNKDSKDTMVTTQSDSDNKLKTLTKKAEMSMDRGDYEEAEELYFELSEITYDEEVQTIYEILYNYNRAVKKMDEGDYKSALKFYERIPPEYVKYSIASDVEDIHDTIKSAQNASMTLAEIENCIYNEDSEGARKLIGTIDRSYLSSSEKQKLDDLVQEVEDLENKKREEEERKRQEEEAKRIAEEEAKRIEEQNRPSGYGHLKKEDAHSLIYNYCYNLVSAINNNDFSIVAPYIYSSSSLYSSQQALVESCRSQGITESFVSANLNNLTKINDTKWEAKVTEQEYVYYADGSQKLKTFNWTYTIEYIGSQFYMTGIR